MQNATISGVVGSVGGIGGGVGRIGGIAGKVELPEMVEAPQYEGPYTVVPKLTRKKLETSGLLMRDDVTIREIQVVQTSNIYGGKTVVIG